MNLKERHEYAKQHMLLILTRHTVYSKVSAYHKKLLYIVMLLVKVNEIKM